LDGEEDKTMEDDNITTYGLEKLKKLLGAAIEEEDYEKASELRDEIKKRNQN
jgi:protein-arginine kinase activator protein McsA